MVINIIFTRHDTTAVTVTVTYYTLYTGIILYRVVHNIVAFFRRGMALAVLLGTILVRISYRMPLFAITVTTKKTPTRV